MSVKSDAKRMLVRARSILSDRKRWIKNDFRRRTPDKVYGYCMLGAVNAASGYYRSQPEAKGDELSDLPPSTDLSEAADEAKRALAVAVGGSVVNFNDNFRRTHEQVLAKMDQAIANLAEEVAKEGVKP